MEIPLKNSKNRITTIEHITEKTMIQKDTCAKHHQHQELRNPSTSVLRSQHLIKKNGYYGKFLLNSRHRVDNFMDIISLKPQTIERDKNLPRAVGNFLKPQITKIKSV